MGQTREAGCHDSNSSTRSGSAGRFLIAGINPYRPFDTAYSGFVNLLAGQISAALASARVYEEERKRATALAELDRAKMGFTPARHGFRTSLPPRPDAENDLWGSRRAGTARYRTLPWCGATANDC